MYVSVYVYFTVTYYLFIWLDVINSEIEYWTTRAELANRFHLFCAFWADAFQISCDVNIYIQFLSSFATTHSSSTSSTSSYSTYSTISFHLQSFISVLYHFCIIISYGLFFSFQIGYNILIAVSDIESFNRAKWKEIENEWEKGNEIIKKIEWFTGNKL